MSGLKENVLELDKHWIPHQVREFRTLVDRLFRETLIPVCTVTWRPISIQEWVELGPEMDLVKVKTGNGYFAVPEIVVARNHQKNFKIKRAIPSKPPTWAVLKRDNFTCQYSGKRLSSSELNVDHVIPRSKGGADSWDNVVACSREINSKKGNRLNEEVGLKLIKLPEEPAQIPNHLYILPDSGLKESWKKIMGLS